MGHPILILQLFRQVSDEDFAWERGQRARCQGVLDEALWLGRRLVGLQALDAQLQSALDVSQFDDLDSGGQRGGAALGSGASGAAYAVDEVFRHLGYVVVDDVSNVVTMQAARGDVGRDQNLVAAFLKSG